MGRLTKSLSKVLMKRLHRCTQARNYNPNYPNAIIVIICIYMFFFFLLMSFENECVVLGFCEASERSMNSIA